MRRVHLIILSGLLAIGSGCQTTQTEPAAPEVVIEAPPPEPTDPAEMLEGGYFDAYARLVAGVDILERPDSDLLLAIAHVLGLGVEIDIERAAILSALALQKEDWEAALLMEFLVDRIPKQDLVHVSKAEYRALALRLEADPVSHRLIPESLLQRGEDGELQADFEPIFRWQLERAQSGQTAAMWNAAFMLNYGFGVEANGPEAFYWLDAAAKARNLRAATMLAGIFMGSKEAGIEPQPYLATYYLKIAAEAGDADSCYLLALCYQNGFGLPRDSSKSVEWMLVAAEKEHEEAMLEMARRYDTGDGIMRNPRRAFTLYSKLHDAGREEALPHYARLLFYGGSKAEPERAVQLLEKAVDNGSLEAMETLCTIYALGPKGIAIDLERAILLGEAALPIASEKMYVNLAYAYNKRNRDQGDLDRSFELNERVAREGNKSGQRGIGELLLRGTTTHGRDLEEALMWIRMAADEGSDLSILQKNTMEAFGLGCEPLESSFEELMEIAVMNPPRSNYPWLRDVRSGKLTAAEKRDQLTEAYRRERADTEPIQSPEIDEAKWRASVELLIKAGEDLPASILRSITPQTPLLREFLWFNERVEVIMTVDADGRIAEIEFIGNPLPPMRAALQRALPHWRFLPAIQNGKPVPSRVRQSFFF